MLGQTRNANEAGAVTSAIVQDMAGWNETNGTDLLPNADWMLYLNNGVFQSLLD